MPLDSQSRDALEAAYRVTNYVVGDGKVSFTIRLDDDNVSLRAFLTDHNAGTWAFLTAYNPFSQTLPHDENIVRQSMLIAMLADLGYKYYRGRGVGDDWEEPSLFIVNIGREEAIRIGRQFDQNAILWGAIGGEAELIWCD